MKQLTGLDASFLYMETPTSYGHVNGLGIYEKPDDPDFRPYDAFMEQIERRLHLLEPFRRRLVNVPFGLDHPYWINDPDFDLEFHVRHIAIPPPGDLEQLSAQVARIIGRPMDRSRPLWEAYVLEGLPDNRFAVLTKTHHAAVDGAAGVELMTLMLDADPEGDELPADDGSFRLDREPGDLEMMGRTVLSMARRPRRMVRLNLNVARKVADVTRNKGMASMVGAARQQLAPVLGGRAARDAAGPKLGSIAAPRTPFNASIGPHRRLAIQSVALSDIKTLKSAVGATVNDIVMSMCAGALRRYLEHHEVLPEQPLRAMVPVSIRSGDEVDKWTNRVSGLVATLPTNESDPLVRIQLVHDAMVAAKETFDMVPAEALVDLAQFSSPAVAVQAARLATSMNLGDRVNPPVNVVISNVPGPRQPLYMGGAKLERYFPVSTIAEGMGLNITVHSYLDSLDIGLVACRDLVPDLELLLEMHLDELDAMFVAVGLERGSPSA